jgi:hypothetical protein
LDALHLLQTIRKDPAHRRSDATDEVEHAVSLGNLNYDLLGSFLIAYCGRE